MSSQEYKMLEDLLYKSYKAQDSQIDDKMRGHYLNVISNVEQAKKARRALELTKCSKTREWLSKQDLERYKFQRS